MTWWTVSFQGYDYDYKGDTYEEVLEQVINEMSIQEDEND